MGTAKRQEKAQGFGRTSRQYILPDGRVFDSVTSILSVVGKPALINWAANKERALVLEASADLYEDAPTDKRMGRLAWISSLENRLGKVKAHQKELEKAGEIGSMAHAMIEWTLRKRMGQVVGEAPELRAESSYAFSEFERWEAGADLEPLMIEQTVWSSSLEYAGTMDLLAKLARPDGALVHAVIDWKTGKGIYDEALMQSAAYVQALIEMGHAPVPDVWGLIVRLPKVVTDPPFEVRWISPEERQEHLVAFMAAKALWDWQQKMQGKRS